MMTIKHGSLRCKFSLSFSINHRSVRVRTLVSVYRSCSQNCDAVPHVVFPVSSLATQWACVCVPRRTFSKAPDYGNHPWRMETRGMHGTHGTHRGVNLVLACFQVHECRVRARVQTLHFCAYVVLYMRAKIPWVCKRDLS